MGRNQSPLCHPLYPLNIHVYTSSIAEDDAMIISPRPVQEISQVDKMEIEMTTQAKLTFGFRNDCAKCQQGIPGHFSHLR